MSCAISCDYALETLADDAAALVIDATGFLKQDEPSAALPDSARAHAPVESPLSGVFRESVDAFAAMRTESQSLKLLSNVMGWGTSTKMSPRER
jgi:hypothetical protein